MPSETAKEIVPVIDLSVTEYKKDMMNLHDSVSPTGRSNEETCHSAAEEQVHSCERVGTSSEMKKDKLNNRRYFVIKSLNHQNIQVSIKKGIWATQVMNEPILEEAFQNSGKVILIFSVNMSGFFQGYAQMMSSVGWRRDNIWNQGNGKNNPWGRSFKVKWLRLHDLPFQRTLHLKNPWNDFKPVKISRDCQELPGDIGEALCELLDEGDDLNVNLNRDEISGDGFSARRPYIEPFHSVQDEDFNVPPLHMAPLLYSSLLYQHQAEASRFQLPHQRADVLLNNISNGPGTSKVKQSRHCRTNGSSANRINSSSRTDSWGLSAEGSPLIGNFTEDDILEMGLRLVRGNGFDLKLDCSVVYNQMSFCKVYGYPVVVCSLHNPCPADDLLTYEEYLEAHTQGSRRLHLTAAGRSTSLQKSSSSKERSDDSQSASSSKKRTYRQSLE